MQNTSLISILTTQLGERIVMKDGDYIYLSDSTVVSDDDLATAKATQSSYEDSNTAKDEYDWASDELASSDIALNKVLDEDDNAVGTESEWRTYRKELRAYCTVSDNIYEVVGSERPTSPADSTDSEE